MAAQFFKKFLPESAVERFRRAFLFRPEDPYHMNQVLSANFKSKTVERIKGNRIPSPGSRPAPRIPIRTSEDDYYQNTYFLKDPRNLKKNVEFSLNSTEPVLISMEPPRSDTHGKRKITLLPFDPTGNRTTKTVTWAGVEPILNARIPDHLPHPEWEKDEEEIQADREKRGLPPAVGRRYRAQFTANYNQVRW
eukprot:gene10138-11876_t